MRKRLHILKKYLKYKKHISYIEKRVVELRASICQQACLYGSVDTSTRDLFLKYNDYLKRITKQ